MASKLNLIKFISKENEDAYIKTLGDDDYE